MCGSGRRIAGMETTVVRLQTAVHGWVEIAPGGFCAAVLGTTVHGICVPRSATGTPLPSETTTSAVSVLPEIYK